MKIPNNCRVPFFDPVQVAQIMPSQIACMNLPLTVTQYHPVDPKPVQHFDDWSTIQPNSSAPTLKHDNNTGPIPIPPSKSDLINQAIAEQEKAAEVKMTKIYQKGRPKKHDDNAIMKKYLKFKEDYPHATDKEFCQSIGINERTLYRVKAKKT